MRWRKKLWGVEFKGSIDDDKPMLLGSAWHALGRSVKYAGEPTRALLFETREDVRAWCREQRQKNAGRADCCGQWRFRPVKVIETVQLATGQD